MSSATNFSKLAKGNVLSETQYYVVDEVKGDKVRIINEDNQPIVVDKNYVEKCLVSANQYSKEEVVNRTQATQIFASNPFTAITVNFNKQVDKKDVVKEIMDNIGKATISEIEKAVTKGVGKALEGEERTMVGYHTSTQNEFGRFSFIDMEKEKGSKAGWDARHRLVDPRGINWLIVKGVKYKVK